MKNRINKLIVITIIAVCFVSVNTAWGQWTFTATLRTSGNCYVVNLPIPPFDFFSTKAECEQMRNIILGIESNYGGCHAYYECTRCTGTDIVIPGQGSSQTNPLNQTNSTTGNLNLIGTSTGQPFFTSHPIHETVDFIDQTSTQQNLLNSRGRMVFYNGINVTGDKRFDNEWSKLYGRSTDYINFGRPDEAFSKGEGRVIYYSGRRASYLPNESLSERSGYQVMKELGESVGLDISNYISEEFWNKDIRDMSSEEVAEWNRQYDKFVMDVNKRQKGEPIDPKGEEESIFTEAVIDKMIDITAEVATAVIPQYTIPGAVATVAVRASQEGLKWANATYHGNSCDGVGTMGGRFLRNVTTDFAFGVGGKMVGDLLGSAGKVTFKEANIASKESKIITRTAAKAGGNIEQKFLGYERRFLLEYKPTNAIAKKGDNIVTAFKNETGINLRKATNDNLLNKANQWQGKGNYPGVDDWVVVEIPKGTKIHGGLPGQSEYYAATSNINVNGSSVSTYWESLQVKPHESLGYRNEIGVYEVTKDIQGAISKATANPQYGKGGGWQLFIPEYNTTLKQIDIINLPK